MQRLLIWVALIVLLPHLLRFIQWLLTAAFKLFMYMLAFGFLLKLFD